MLNTIFFDLDATLLPFEQDLFIKAYFEEITRVFSPSPFDAKALINALWQGTREMMLNRGPLTNREVFWKCAAGLLGEDAPSYEPAFDRFYTEGFENVRRVLTCERNCAPLMQSLRDRGYRLVLATQPVFPAVAVRTRLSWIGLTPEDFCYVSGYENACSCKPNPLFFHEILQKIGADAADCLMAGNNLREDGAARKAGLSLYIIDDHMENPDNIDPDTVPHGSFADFERMMASLPDLHC